MEPDDINKEKELFARIAEGDESAFRKLVQTYAPILHSMVFKLVRSAAATDDLIQDTFMRVWLNRNKLPDINKPRSWLLKIAYHLSLDFLRSQMTEKKVTTRLMSVQETSSFRNDTAERVDFDIIKNLVGEAVKSLSPQQKKIYRLSREEGLNTQQISQALNIAPSTVKNTLVLALKSIRDYLEKAGYETFISILILALNYFNNQ